MRDDDAAYAFTMLEEHVATIDRARGRALTDLAVKARRHRKSTHRRCISCMSSTTRGCRPPLTVVVLSILMVLIFIFIAKRLLDDLPSQTPAHHALQSLPSSLPRLPQQPPPVAELVVSEPDEAADDSPSLVATARFRIVAEANRSVREDEGSQADPAVEHVALQDAAVELLTSQSACVVQTASSSHRSARASSVYTSSDGLEHHAPSHAFDGDPATFFHSACGLPMKPWSLSFTFDSPTAVSTITLTSDAPADFPTAWELQGRAVSGGAIISLLELRHDVGITCAASALGGSKRKAFTCDEPQSRSYEVSEAPMRRLFQAVETSLR